MSEEEKKAIVILKQWYNYNVNEKEDFEAVDNAKNTLLNLIEKQQKEIEELKEKNKNYFSKTQIENAIHNSVSDYDCLVEKLNQMMYPDFYKN